MPTNHNPDFQKKHKSESPLSRTSRADYPKPTRISLPNPVSPTHQPKSSSGEWNRSIPQAGYVTLGTLRYGVRLSNPSEYFHEKRGEEKRSFSVSSNVTNTHSDYLSNGSSSNSDNNCCCPGKATAANLLPTWNNLKGSSTKPTGHSNQQKTKLPVSLSAKNRRTLSPSSSSSCAAEAAAAPHSSLSLINRGSSSGGSSIHQEHGNACCWHHHKIHPDKAAAFVGLRVPPNSDFRRQRPNTRPYLTVPAATSTSDFSSSSSSLTRQRSKDGNSNTAAAADDNDSKQRITCFNLKSSGGGQTKSDSYNSSALCPKGSASGDRSWFKYCDPCNSVTRSVTPDLNDIVLLRELSAKNGVAPKSVIPEAVVTHRRRSNEIFGEGVGTHRGANGRNNVDNSIRSEIALTPKRFYDQAPCRFDISEISFIDASGGDSNCTQGSGSGLGAERFRTQYPKQCQNSLGSEEAESSSYSHPILLSTRTSTQYQNEVNRGKVVRGSASQQLRQLKQQHGGGAAIARDKKETEGEEKISPGGGGGSSQIKHIYSNISGVVCDNCSESNGLNDDSGTIDRKSLFGGIGRDGGGDSSSVKENSSVDIEREWLNCIRTLSDICRIDSNDGGGTDDQNYRLNDCSVSEEEEVTMDRRRNTFDKWQKLGFGKRSSSNTDLADKTKKDKTERLRELTELLKGNRITTPTVSGRSASRGSCSPPPPIPPPRRQRAQTSVEKSFEKLESIEDINEESGPAKDDNVKQSVTKPLHISASSPHFRILLEDTPNKCIDPPPEIPEPETKVLDDIYPLTPRVESKMIVGSYAQKSIPFRSASFSQVDFNSGKYVIGCPNTDKEGSRPNRNSTSVLETSSLPRKRGDLRLLHSIQHSTPISVSNQGGSIAEEQSLDDCLGISRSNSNCSKVLKTIDSVDNEIEPHQSANTRTDLEPPLETVGSDSINAGATSEDRLSNNDNVIDESLLQTASSCVIPTPVFECCGKEIMGENVTEWYQLPADPADKKGVKKSGDMPRVSIVLPGDMQSDNSSNSSPQENPDSGLVEVRKRHTLNSDESRDSAQDDVGKGTMPLEERRRIDKSKRRKGIYIQWPAIERTPNVSQDSWELESPVLMPPTSNSESNFKDCLRLNVGIMAYNADTLSTASVEPLTPESDSNNNTTRWPKASNRRRSITYQSSEEKDERTKPRNKSNIIRSDSTSDNESDRTPPRERQSASPAPSDDLRRYYKRPLRGPYGQMLEAEMKKPSKLHYDEIFEDLRNTEFRLNSRSPRSKGSHSLDESAKNISKTGKIRKSSANLPIPPFHERAASTPTQIDHLQVKENISSSHKKFPNSVEKLYHDSNASISTPKKLSDPEKSFKSAYNSEISTGKQCKRSASGFLDRSRLGKRNDKFADDTLLRKRSSEIVETPHGPVSSADLLAELLKGSSEKQVTEHAHATSRGATSVLPKAVLRCLDTRTHVVIELFNTEQSYVESLQTIVMKYLNPLKNAENVKDIIDTATVDEIFYMVPSIMSIHERFLEELHKRLDSWDTSQKVGDAFIDVFSSNSVIEVYTCFVNNWNKAKTAIRNTCTNKPAFARFLETMAREHKGKLSLDNLLIKPVQKFPNYELILSRLIKHTDADHPDQNLLQEANKLVHNILMHLNCKEKEALENGQREAMLRELEGVIEGISDLVGPDRSFLLFDLVSMFSGQSTRKERGIFLFSDLLVITSIKKRSGTIKKPNTIYTGSVATTLDTNKYKFLTKMSLNDLEIVKAKDESVRKMIKEIEQLSEDCNKLQKISEIANTIRYPHPTLEDSIKDLQKDVQKQLSDRHSNDTQLSILDFNLLSSDINHNMSILFSKPEKRNQWEEAFTLAKQKLATSNEKNTIPEFLLSIPIRKTRAGLQFTCAASTLGSQNDVWVCNSDGFVGQVCVLSLHPEPTVTSCNGVCNARILCVTSVPSYADNTGKESSELNEVTESAKLNCLDDGKVKQDMGKYQKDSIQLESSSSSDNDSDIEFSAQLNVTAPKEQPTIVTATSSTSLSKDDESDRMQSTMWLGTEDGCIHVYNCTDNIRIKKNKIKIQHICAVYSILYLDNRVFVSLSNGDICVYLRDNSGWNTTSPLNLTVGTVTSPVTKLLNVHGKIWCAIQGVIKVLNTQHLQVESQIQISDSKPITNMVASSNSVWVTIQNSSIIKCFHSTSYELLFEINVSSPVNKILSNCDDIIRQHKAACLRITALLACKDLLWIGTSAGVLLTMPVQHLNNGGVQHIVPSVSHGHTGHVRFLTCVEIGPPALGTKQSKTSSATDPKRLSSKGGDAVSSDGGKGRTEAASVLIISGGDGYEDFRSSNASSTNEVAGREDSTNHLLLWQV